MRSNQPDTSKWLRGPRTSTEDDINIRRARGISQLQTYVDYAESNPFIIKDIDDYTLALEVPFEVEIGGILIRGAIDQILGLPDGVEVRDLKTGNREAGKIQLGVYSYVVEKIFGWPVKSASFFYAKDAKVVTLTREELNRYDEKYLSDLFQTLEAGIENNIFLPNPSSSCSLCPVRDRCREMGSQPQPLSER
jgi:putative RecB family exonuclease